MSSKLRIRIGDFEIDCEGTEDFLKKELPALLRTTMDLHNATGSTAAAARGSGASHTKGKKLPSSLTESRIIQ